MDISEMSPDQLYNFLDRLTLHGQIYGRGRSPDADQARHYCKQERKRIRRELKRRNLPTTRPDDRRVYGPGQARWQQAGKAQ